MVKRLPAMRETRVWFLGWEDPLKKEMAIHSSTLAWKIPWMEEPDRLQSMGSQRVGHDWVISLSLSLCNKQFMVWACQLPVCFCWVYRASPSSATKNIVNLILVLTIWWCLFGELSLERECLLWPAGSLDKTLLAFALLNFVLQGQTSLLFWVSLDFLLLHSNPLWWKWDLLGELVLKGVVDLHRTDQLQRFKHQ